VYSQELERGSILPLLKESLLSPMSEWLGKLCENVVVIVVYHDMNYFNTTTRTIYLSAVDNCDRAKGLNREIENQ